MKILIVPDAHMSSSQEAYAILIARTTDEKLINVNKNRYGDQPQNLELRDFANLVRGVLIAALDKPPLYFKDLKDGNPFRLKAFPNGSLYVKVPEGKQVHRADRDKDEYCTAYGIGGAECGKYVAVDDFCEVVPVHIPQPEVA